ncbi:GrpB family protein [Candidatus Saccharibacteria bacterium]|nr:GrpB family protein [Candidatus Saccharibacteria bacterium]
MPVIINEFSSFINQRFLDEKKRLEALLPSSVRIEHVGSTAVGIGGKNIVDILIGVSDTKQMKEIRDILTKNGYYDGRNNHDDRIFLASREEETGEGDFHVHICLVSGNTYKNFIILRNYLLDNPEKASEYFSKKQQFAKESNYDREKYKTLKSDYVSRLLTEAKRNSDS